MEKIQRHRIWDATRVMEVKSLFHRNFGGEKHSFGGFGGTLNNF